MTGTNPVDQHAQQGRHTQIEIGERGASMRWTETPKHRCRFNSQRYEGRTSPKEPSVQQHLGLPQEHNSRQIIVAVAAGGSCTVYAAE